MNTKHQPPTDIRPNPRTAAARTPARGGRAKSPRRPRGSVLILVVALLVLMALIGTAWISTARVDRAASIATVNEAQIDLLTDGMVNMVKAAVVGDITDAGAVRRGAGYVHTDSVTNDAFLASRVPVFAYEVARPWTDAASINLGLLDPPIYEAGRLVRGPGDSDVSGTYYLCLQTHRADSSKQPGNTQWWARIDRYDTNARDLDADNPVFWPGTTRILPPDAKFEDITGKTAGYTQRTGMRITSVPVGETEHPGFLIYDPGQGRSVAVPAADTDGDGLADASYFKLPIGRVNGVDYYGAYRIVDNSSAVNVSTAYRPVPSSATSVAHFPSSLNLEALLLFSASNPTELASQRNGLNHWRFNDGGNNNSDVTGNPNPAMNDQGGRRNDFFYGSLTDLFWMGTGRRQGNPGLWSNGLPAMRSLPSTDAATLAYRGGTLINPDAMNSVTLTASSLIEQLLPQTLYNYVDNHPDVSGANLNNGYAFDVSRRSSYPVGNRLAWQELFARNFDYLNRRKPPNYAANDPSTFTNRRNLMTVSNPVSSAVPSRLVPRNGPPDPRVQTPGRWDGRFHYDVGDYVMWNNLLYVCISPVPANQGLPPGDIPTTALEAPSQIERPANAPAWEPRPFEHFPTKASANAGSYGQLFLAFWQVMGENASHISPPFPGESTLQTPFKDPFRWLMKNSPAQAEDPNHGTRFTTGTPYAPFSTSGPPAADHHPLRGFRNPVRTVPRTTAPEFNTTTPRLMIDATMRLRAAAAAVNAIDMRDSDDTVTFQDIHLGVNLERRGVPIEESDDRLVLGRARVYGYEKQPFLTEVFAQTDKVSQPQGTQGLNPNGYVALEFYNPYPFPIDLINCRLATIDRRARDAQRTLTVLDPAVAANTRLTPNLGRALSNLATPDIPPTVVPPNGYLVLENFDARAGGAGAGLPNEQPPARYRPGSTGLPITLTGGSSGPVPVPAAPPPGQPGPAIYNFAYVPNLHTVMDREVVLLRPLGTEAGVTLNIPGRGLFQMLRYAATPERLFTEAVDFAPLDSYDFTGLRNPDSAVSPASTTLAQLWHYSRATGPGKDWRFVYPGRYDSRQPITATGGRPRQQGTREAVGGVPGGVADGAAAPGWDPTTQPDPWSPDAAGGGTLPLLPPTLGGMAGNLPVNATYYPYEYVTQLSNGALPTDPQLSGAAGPNPVRAATGNAFPFGGYARNGDLLQIPYMGSYRIKLTTYQVPPYGNGRDNQGLVPHFGSVDLNTQVLELNSITMDSIYAEDSDPNNHVTGTPPLVLAPPSEQIGRFTPSLLDLEVAAAGTVEAASVGGGANEGTLTDSRRTEALNYAKYEIVITDGPGKGQSRPVTSYQAGGRFRVFPDWEFPLGPTSRYILRKGTDFEYPGLSNGAAVLRSTGNKYWATRLFDYVTADSPQDDHLPAADPASYARLPGMEPPQAISNSDPNAAPAISYGIMRGGGGSGIKGSVNLIDKSGFYADGWIQFVTGRAAGEVRPITAYDGPSRQITCGAFSRPTQGGDVFRIFGKSSEDLTGIQGLVNINTAPWPVLAQLPFVDGNPTENTLIAQEIVKFRDGDPSAGIQPQGPFRSLFDLLRVPDFAARQNGIAAGPSNPGNAEGDITPLGVGVADSVRYDFEEQYLLLNRISNMITTRSDSFTAYVLVQGWRGAGDPNQTPELVVQRRRAFVVDRTGVTPTNKDPAVQFLYND